VVVDRVTRGGPAAKAGLRGGRHLPGGRYAVGDIIIAINEIEIKDFDDLYNALDRFKPGDMVKVKILREGKAIVLPVTLINIQN
jgi:S1-C subfamily serine protease